MTFDQAVEYGLTLGLIVFGGGSLVRYILERRQAKARGYVAEATAELQIDASQLANVRAQLDLMRAAWNAERVSMQGRITNLATELAEERADSARKDAELRDLRTQVDSLQVQLTSLGRRLAELTGDDPAPPPDH